MHVSVEPLKIRRAFRDARSYVIDMLSMETADEMNSDSAGESVM